MPQAATRPRALEVPGVLRRALCLAYEGFLLIAVWLIAGFAYVAGLHALGLALPRAAFQLYLLLVAAAYLIPQWHGGHTLAMRTWRIRIVCAQGTPVTIKRAALRYLFALLSWTLAGAGYLWAFADRDRQFLHDRLAGTRLVSTSN